MGATAFEGPCSRPSRFLILSEPPVYLFDVCAGLRRKKPDGAWDVCSKCFSVRLTRSEALTRYSATPDLQGCLARMFNMSQHPKSHASQMPAARRPSSARVATSPAFSLPASRPKSAKARIGAQPGAGPIMRPPWALDKFPDSQVMRFGFFVRTTSADCTFSGSRVRFCSSTLTD